MDRYYDDIEVVEGEVGRSAFDPQLKVNLWIYSYSKGIYKQRGAVAEFSNAWIKDKIGLRQSRL